MQTARVIKTADEITLLTQACAMVDAAYEELYGYLRPGVRENECVGAGGEGPLRPGQRVRRRGQRDLRRALLTPHPHVYSDRLIRPGRPGVLRHPAQLPGLPHLLLPHVRGRLGVGARSGTCIRRHREYMDQAIALARPGTTTADVVSPPTAAEFGFPDEEAASPLHNGHGVGLSIWEKPIFSRLVSLDHPEVLEEGMVFALETFWPASDGFGAARIEEQLMVTADGCEVITRFRAEGPARRRTAQLLHRVGPAPRRARAAVAPEPPRRGRPPRGGAVDARTVSVGSNISVCGVAAGCSIRSSRSSAARAPIAACGMWTVVSGGAKRSANGMSLNPTTEHHAARCGRPPRSPCRRPAPAGRCAATMPVGASRAASSSRAQAVPAATANASACTTGPRPSGRPASSIASTNPR